MADNISWHIGALVTHGSYGRGVVVDETPGFIKVYFHDIDKSKQLPREATELEILEAGEGGPSFSLEEVEDVVWRVMEKRLGGEEHIALGERWNGGTLSLQPQDKSLSAKEMPLEAFFHKIVMLRDRLRVLEQQINGHAKLNDEDKVHLQQYITRAYGSLTSFNTLFKHKDDQFKGAGKSD